MAEIMMQLGSYQFGIDTAAYQEFSRSTEYRWPSQERVGQMDALQYTGPGSDSVTLTGLVFPEWNGGTGQLDDMRREASKGEPLIMVDGLGRIHGQWVIERVEETQSTFAQRGVARRQAFTLQIRKYDDGPNVSNP